MTQYVQCLAIMREAYIGGFFEKYFIGSACWEKSSTTAAAAGSYDQL